MDDYEQWYLCDLFLASLGEERSARTWIDRNEAMVLAAYYLGFVKLGKNIRQSLRGVVRALLRQGKLEKSGAYIRKAI